MNPHPYERGRDQHGHLLYIFGDYAMQVSMNPHPYERGREKGQVVRRQDHAFQ